MRETETFRDDDAQRSANNLLSTVNSVLKKLNLLVNYSAKDVDGGRFESCEDSSHGVSATSPATPTHDCQSKTVALKNHTLPELEDDDNCSLSGSEETLNESEK